MRERSSAESFVTVCAAWIESDRRTLTCSLAGHPAPLLLADGVASLVVPIGAPLGMLPEPTWDAGAIALPEEWSLLLYTDGLVEGLDGPSSSQRFGARRLANELSSLAPVPARITDRALDVLLERVKQANGGDLADDVGMLFVRCVTAPTGDRRGRPPGPLDVASAAGRAGQRADCAARRRGAVRPAARPAARAREPAPGGDRGLRQRRPARLPDAPGRRVRGRGPRRARRVGRGHRPRLRRRHGPRVREPRRGSRAVAHRHAHDAPRDPPGSPGRRHRGRDDVLPHRPSTTRPAGARRRPPDSPQRTTVHRVPSHPPCPTAGDARVAPAHNVLQSTETPRLPCSAALHAAARCLRH